MIDNTARRMREEPSEGLLLLGESMITGSPASFIENQERAGQRQLVNSDRLPSEYSGERADWEALGFAFGDPDPDDPLFMPATLPEGWTRKAGGHPMGSAIVDALGCETGEIVIVDEATFYDRKANMHLVGLRRYVSCAVEFDGPAIVISGEWATRDAVLKAMREHRDDALREAAEFDGYAASTASRSAGNRESCAEIADGKRATAAKYDAAIDALSAAPEVPAS
jgi:hypothetical protein